MSLIFPRYSYHEKLMRRYLVEGKCYSLQDTQSAADFLLHCGFAPTVRGDNLAFCVATNGTTASLANGSSPPHPQPFFPKR